VRCKPPRRSPSPGRVTDTPASSRHARATYWQHIASWRFALTLAVVFGIDFWLEHTTVAERAVLGGVDVASQRVATREAEHTAVIGIGPADVQRFFAGKRPIPPRALDSVVTSLMRLNPRVLVIDIFTDGPGYSDSLFTDSLVLRRQDQIVWAAALDTTSETVLPPLGGLSDPPGRVGLATILADEDRLVRAFRPRFVGTGSSPAADTVLSLPLAAALAYTPADEREHLTRRLSDSASVALRRYERAPPFYLLEDVLQSVPQRGGQAPPSLADRVLVLGFIDGSDQVLTPRGVRSGPDVVADAIETLLDERGLITRLPAAVEWGIKLGLALLVAYIHYRLSPRAAIRTMIALAVLVVYGGFILFEHFGYWSSFILIVVGLWIEQLYEEVVHPGHAAHPAPAIPHTAGGSPGSG